LTGKRLHGWSFPVRSHFGYCELGTSASRDPASGEPISDRFEEELTLDVGGLTHDPDGASVHVRWLRQPLTPGQRITVAVVETETADPPQNREREDPAWAAQRKREYYERLKLEYGDA
jgi:hypothetical protein